MLLSLLYALTPVALGGALALLPGRSRGWMGPLRTLALTAALTVVLAELLPSAVASLGPLALLAFLAGLTAPTVFERLGDRLLTGERALGLELAFLGISAHQVVDGLQIGAARAVTQGGLLIALAIAAHSAPLVASAALSYVSQLGRRTAARRLAWLASATALGVVLGAQAGAGPLADWTPWIQAAIAGLLLHILSHDLSSDPPHSAGQRALDLAAAAAGVCGPLLVLESHHHGPPVEHMDFGPALLDLGLESAPALLLGLGIWALARSPRAARSHRIAPWLGAAALGAEGYLLSAQLLGPRFALLWFMGATALSGLTAVILGDPRPEQPPGRSPLAALDERLAQIGPWLVAGLLAAACLRMALPAGLSFAATPWAWTLPILIAVALSPRLSVSALPLLAAAVWARGLSPGIVLTGLLLGASVGLERLSAWRRARGSWVAAAGLAGLLLGASASGWIADGVLSTSEATAHTLRWVPLEYGAAITLGALMLRGIWRAGIRGWFLTLLGAGRHRHDHE